MKLCAGGSAWAERRWLGRPAVDGRLVRTAMGVGVGIQALVLELVVLSCSPTSVVEVMSVIAAILVPVDAVAQAQDEGGQQQADRVGFGGHQPIIGAPGHGRCATEAVTGSYATPMNERWRWLLAGSAAAALALAAGELVAGVLGGPSLVAAIGTLIIDLQPPGAKDLMVAIFGTNDKLALEIAVAIGAILIGAVLGPLAQRDIRIAFAGFGVFGTVAFLAAIQDPSADRLIAAISV